MILYGASMSPFVRKTMAYAREKGIDLEVEPVGLGKGSDAFYEASPFKKMPGLRDPGADNGKDFVISDSSAIITYLEAKFPDPALIPASPIARARTIWFDEFADTILTACGGKIFFNRFLAPRVLKREGDMAAADAAEANELPPLLEYLEKTIPESGFLVEDRITLADIAVASPFVNLEHCACAIDADRFPRTIAYIETILARPSFAPIIASERALVAALP